MSYPESSRPPGCTLACWSWKYQDGDPECGQCPYRDSCRTAVLWRSSQQPTVAPQSIVPLPSRPFIPHQPVAPTVYQPQNVYRPPAPVAAPTQTQVVQYQQPVQSAVPYSDAVPHPLSPWQRPGAPSPAYYFNQYPGESTPTRLGKNMVLRAAEGMFGELMYFFRHWTWPPSAGK